MNEKERYRILCKEEISIPIFSRDWWLDCVCGESNWDVLIYENRDQVEAVMVYFRLSKTVITMPPQCQAMGIWFNPVFEDEQYATNLYRRQKISTWFIDHLPRHTIFFQTFHHSYTDWLPFYWKGYKQTVRYTYLLPDISDQDKLYRNMNRFVHRNLRKAERNGLEIKTEVPVEALMNIYAKTYINKKMKVYEPEALRRLIEKGIERNQGKILGAYDKSGNLCAALFIAWQDNCAYQIAGSSDPEYKDTGAYPFLIW
ncbi:GNAT family N-acetyltransferase, partial [Bacteroidales bacterium OttesenSCG-928-A17]|nr:GNAT family N-acetyltransferase [Bacteroidales bacterium OttesenSCG-928-A17]